MTEQTARAGNDPSARSGVSALELALRPLRRLLDDPSLTELCINRPGEAFVERTGDSASPWARVELAFADFDWCLRLAKLVAHSTRQRIDEESPLLSAALPSGERVQFVIPPATEPGTVAISIRRPAERTLSITELADRGLFASTRVATEGDLTDDTALLELLNAKRFSEFVIAAVRARKNIIVSGPTGSGKTTFTKALIREIAPLERLITIEDAAELALGAHPNHVRLFYSKDGQGLAKVGPRRLLESCLRMRPDRILLAELRSDEAYDYLRNVCSGHPGSITSVHAASVELAFEQLALLIRQNPAGRELPRSELQALLLRLVDVVIQFGFDGSRRVIREIWFDPDARLRLGLLR
jgi:type IV secretion system protein VirB11